MAVLGARALNRASLARQHLLDRADVPVLAAVAHLGGLQAQEPQEPFVGLWSRLRDFDPAELSKLLLGRQVVRTHLMRRTVHLVAAADALAWSGRHAGMLRQRMLGAWRAELGALDLEDLAAAGSALLADGTPRTIGEISRELGERFAVAHRAGPAGRVLGETVVAALVPTVQVPPRGMWRTSGRADYHPLEAWLGRPVDPAPPEGTDPVGAALVRRYLAAYGPASSSDLRAWCGLSGLTGAVTEVRPELVSFRDERGRELLDLPGAPRPDPDTPAPVRFLPAFDNAILGYDDRSRIIDTVHRGLSVAGERVVLLDGRVAATWTTTKDGALTVTPLRRFTRANRTEVAEEARRLAAFLSDGARPRVTVARSPA